MFHRFASPDLGTGGHDPKLLARALEYLRRNKYSILGLSELLDMLGAGVEPSRNCVVFTVDDGYTDFAEVASPVFAAYDCPVSVFLVTGFVSGVTWNWYDRVEWSFLATERKTIAIDCGAERFAAAWSTPQQALAASNDLVERLKRIDDPLKESCIDATVNALGVDVPSAAPSKYRAMTWADVDRCARRGATFGPHTVSHPILSRVDATRARREIMDSWKVLTASTSATVPVFCYPNGTGEDFSLRDEQLVAAAGLRAGVSAIEGTIDFGSRRTSRLNLLSLPRFAYSENHERFVQIVSGLEDLKTRVVNRLERARTADRH